MALAPKEIYEKIRERFPDGIEEVVDCPGDPYCIVKREAYLDICRWLRDDEALRFNLLSCLSGTDDGTDFWVVLHLTSIPKNHTAVLKVRVAREGGSCPSVAEIWKTADWHERETYDMYGMKFDGHPDLRRILLPEDWPGFPLRKDYEFPDEYQGIPLK